MRNNVVILQLNTMVPIVFMQDETRTSVLPEQIQYYLQLAQQSQQQQSQQQNQQQGASQVTAQTTQVSQAVTQPTAAGAVQQVLTGKHFQNKNFHLMLLNF